MLSFFAPRKSTPFIRLFEQHIFSWQSKKHNNIDNNGSEDIENIEPSKKKRKQEDQTINYCPIINPVQKVIKIHSLK